MGNGKTSPETGAVAAVEQEELGRHRIVKHAGHASSQVIVCPPCAQSRAFEPQEGDLIEGVNRSQAGIELETVDDPYPVVEPDMLRAQIAMAIDKAALHDALSEELCMAVEKSTLGPIGAADQSTRQAYTRVEQGAAVLRKAPLPFGKVRRRDSRHRPYSPVESAKAHDQSLKLPGFEPAIENELLEREVVLQSAHHDEPIDDRAGTADGKALRRGN
jgi:hypothetical protein